MHTISKISQPCGLKIYLLFSNIDSKHFTEFVHNFLSENLLMYRQRISFDRSHRSIFVKYENINKTSLKLLCFIHWISQTKAFNLFKA